MAINADYFKSVVDFFLKKNTRGRTTINDFINAVNFASRQKFMESYRAYESTQKISDDLKPFKKKATLAINLTGGFTLPSDYSHAIAVRYNNANVKRLNEDEVADVLTSTIVAPSTDYPVYVLETNQIRVYPSTITSGVEFHYLGMPTDFRWAYTIGITGREVYDSINSVNLEWDTSCFNDLVMRTLNCMGVNLRDADIVQISEVKEQKGV